MNPRATTMQELYELLKQGMHVPPPPPPSQSWSWHQSPPMTTTRVPTEPEPDPYVMAIMAWREQVSDMLAWLGENVNAKVMAEVVHKMHDVEGLVIKHIELAQMIGEEP